jgi:HK97 gp10 family phage protein
MANEQLSTSLTLNYQAIEDMLFTSAERGLDNALEIMLQKAKKNAPVRDIFQKDGRAGAERVPRGIQKRRRYKHQHKVFGRKIRHHQDVTRDRFMAQWRSQKTPSRRIYHEGKRIEGTSKDLHPILRWRDADGRPQPGRVHGDFRVAHMDRGRVQFEGATVTNPATGRQTTVGTGRFLSAKGRSEVKHIEKLAAMAKRAGKTDQDFEAIVGRSSLVRRRALGIEGELSKAEKAVRKRGLTSDASGQLRVGGRLRDEIYRTEVRRSGSKMYGDVVAPTEYAKYQEYGTSKHRAQPFMRPALYDMRGRFQQIVARSMRSRGTR